MKFSCLLLLLVLSFTHCLASELIDEPQHCLVQQKFPCAVRAPKPSQKFKLNGGEIVLGPATSLILYSHSQGRLLEGYFWMHGVKEFHLTSGFVQFSLQGDVWVDRTISDKIVVKNMDGIVSVGSSLLSLKQEIPSGFENWYSLINSDGDLGQGILKSIDAKSFIPKFLRLADLPKKQSIELVQLYKKSWQGSVEASSNLYQEVISRRMASIQEQQSAELKRQQSKQREQQQLREMYRSRFEDGQ